MFDFERDGINYRVGCLFHAAKNHDVDIIAHQANCFKLMGSGFALFLKDEYPEAYHIDMADRRTPEQRLGKISLVNANDGTMLYNLYGQYRPGKNTDYTALRSALRLMASHVKAGNPSERIGIPLIGCGVGGGNWAIVSTIIKQEFEELDYTVYIRDMESLPNNGV